MRIAPVTVIALLGPDRTTVGTMRLIYGVFDGMHESVKIDVLREGLSGL